MSETDHYGTDYACNIKLAAVKEIFRAAGATELYFKRLAANDNSKNQIYFGGSLSVLNVIPGGQVTIDESSSEKQSLKEDDAKITVQLDFSWIAPDGTQFLAPTAKLILYPQYPEARFSGFLQSSKIRLSEWMAPQKSGRAEGRALILGVASTGKVFGYLAVPNSCVAKELESETSIAHIGSLIRIAIDPASPDLRQQVLNELLRIHETGWIAGKRLRGDQVVPCNASNCGGYTLEAELGVHPNGYAEPDYLGWEVKQFAVQDFTKLTSQVITLMTPEPSGGFYKDAGVQAFIHRYGYPDRKGQPDRINFGGVHRFDKEHHLTKLTLTLLDADVAKNKFSPRGGIALVDRRGETAAIWHFEKLLQHWKRKHAQAVYVPCRLKKEGGTNRYHYGNSVLMGEGTEFIYLLKSIVAGALYYDPGIKLENVSGPSPKVKRRSQFRMKSGQLENLYDSFGPVSVGGATEAGQNCGASDGAG
jgi:hypothetical protein